MYVCGLGVGMGDPPGPLGGMEEVFLRYVFLLTPQPPHPILAHSPPGTGCLCGPDLPSSPGRLLSKQTSLYGVVVLLETGGGGGVGGRWGEIQQRRGGRPNRKRWLLHTAGGLGALDMPPGGHWWGQGSPSSVPK